MSQDEQLKIMRLKIHGDLTNKSKDDVFKIMLGNAEVVALNTLYPYDKTKEDLPYEKRLKNWQTRCAIELYKKIGTTNVQSYSENGLSVTFLTGLISSDLMKEIGPSKAGVPR